RSETIDGIRYFRSCSSILPPTKEVRDDSPVRAALRVAQNLLMLKMALDVARKYKPRIVHAHSPFTCGLVADATAAIRGIPAVYEVRGIWEGSHASRRGVDESTLRYKGVRFLENLALRHADFCCVIGTALEHELRLRGVPADKIRIFPNGVDTRSFFPAAPPSVLIDRLGLAGKTAIGYIGSFFQFEGLDIMVAAMGALAPDFPDLRLLLVGDGELMPRLRELAAELNIEERVIFTGRIPHAAVADYYRACDFLVLPRRDSNETRLVTPLKPMEIMAMEKAVVASDISGHREMVEDGMNGLMFKSEDPVDLADKCRKLLTDATLREELGRRARTWVLANRDWRVLVDRYLDLYAALAG
ncbi:MAG: glycosyltransferase family 4 protein, partial [Pseudomonadota bacterium]